MDDGRSGGADPLSDLLNGVRTSGGVFNQADLRGAWGIRFADGSPLALAAVLTGSAWITAAGGVPVRLGEGDVAVLTGAAPYTITSSPAFRPNTLIGPGGQCTTTGPDAAESPGNGQATVLVNGLYTVTVTGTASGRLLAALPPLAVVPADQGTCPTAPAAIEEMGRTLPGRQALLDRTLDLMLITALRAWFTRPGAPVPAWYRAHSDPALSRALHLLHRDLARPWTVQALATEAGLSRAGFAQRFTTLLGQPPMTYLRHQRLTRAAELLADPDTTLAAIAHQVGFSSPFALSTAFKKTYGTSPTHHRTRTHP